MLCWILDWGTQWYIMKYTECQDRNFQRNQQPLCHPELIPESPNHYANFHSPWRQALSPSWKFLCNHKGIKSVCFPRATTPKTSMYSSCPEPLRQQQTLGLIVIGTSHGGSYLRNAYKVRMIPARQNPSKNLSVLNIVTFTDSATVSPKMRMKMVENSSTGRRPTLYAKRGEIQHQC